MSESVIHDIGYQRYTGARLGRAYAVRSLFSHGFRAAFGLGRTAKAKIFPWVVIGLVGVICVIFAVARSQGELIAYYEIPEVTSIFTLIFVAVVAPELVSRDLRNTLLPLYFSRPIQRSDYVVAKVAALITACWLLVAGPMLLVFFAGAFGADAVFWDEFVGLLKGFAIVGVYAIIYSTVALLVASIASRRAFAAGGIAAVFMVSVPIVAILSELGSEKMSQMAPAFSPTTLPEGIAEWLFEPVPEMGSYGWVYGTVGVALPVLCVLLLLLRYRRVSL